MYDRTQFPILKPRSNFGICIGAEHFFSKTFVLFSHVSRVWNRVGSTFILDYRLFLLLGGMNFEKLKIEYTFIFCSKFGLMGLFYGGKIPHTIIGNLISILKFSYSISQTVSTSDLNQKRGFGCRSDFLYPN